MRTSIDGLGEGARLPIQMKVEVQPVQVAEHLRRQTGHGRLRHLAENGVAQLSEQRRARSGRAVAKRQRDHAHCQHRFAWACEVLEARVFAQQVHHLFEHERHRDREQLRADQQSHGKGHTQFDLVIVLWPNKAQQLSEDLRAGQLADGFVGAFEARVATCTVIFDMITKFMLIILIILTLIIRIWTLGLVIFNLTLLIILKLFSKNVLNQYTYLWGVKQGLLFFMRC